MTKDEIDIKKREESIRKLNTEKNVKKTISGRTEYYAFPYEIIITEKDELKLFYDNKVKTVSTNVKDAFTPDELQKMVEAGDFSFVRDASETITFLPEIKLDAKQTKDIKFGKKIAFPFDVKLEGDERIYYRATSEDKLIAVVFPAVEKGELVMRIERLYAHD